uniref:Methyltransferase domain-containing protein n=1 Tax=Attheya septentrionalis TaxID=420275 RepID=A0A7S2XIY5_9STRA|mmetsp:Transcript_13124/g.23790  ORF Transcript_13124/g.23790 Transcript_13124/m.23790 type:complete len:667 (+) Transcript_13124:95-2095(+)
MIGGWASHQKGHNDGRRSRRENGMVPTSSPRSIPVDDKQSSVSLSSSSTRGQCLEVVLSGRVVSDVPNGRFGRQIHIQQADDGESSSSIIDDGCGVVVVHLDATKAHGTSAWMKIRGARKLICPGVFLRVHGIRRNGIANTSTSTNHVTTADTEHDTTHKRKHNDADNEKKQPQDYILATNIIITGAVPATPYLARVLSFPLETLVELFGEETLSINLAATAVVDKSDTSRIIQNAALVHLTCALRPCSVVRCQDLRQMCHEETLAGRYGTLFKKPELLQLCDDMRECQGWTRGARSAPTTSSDTWSALLRMEQQWCRETTDDNNDVVDVEYNGPIENEAANSSMPMADESMEHHDRVVYGGVDVDPSLNLPDPNDTRRQQYVDQRKRPQVLWMLRLIRRLLDCGDENVVKHPNNSHAATTDIMTPRIYHVADIGGGRGDLANAVAAYFAQPHIREFVHVHVTVVDINQSSLDAGRERATLANLESHMSFVLCDLANESQVSTLLLNQQQSFDLVFGLHCCGGLAEAAVELALKSRASFCISTCCFRSNMNLATLSSLSDTMMMASESSGSTTSYTGLGGVGTKRVEQHQKDRDLVSTLAIVVGGEGQDRSIRALNAMRLAAAKEKVYTMSNITNNASGKFRTWQETFPIQYSNQNRVMVGVFDDL